jgi:RHS repeat-associated protein
MVTDASQAKTWDVVNDPWGNALPLSTPTIAQDLRLPGQVSQVESGLFQNWNRDYDPTLGRYIQADPIGLAGGGNVFGYVEGNPLFWADPLGLRKVILFNPDIPSHREFISGANADRDRPGYCVVYAHMSANLVLAWVDGQMLKIRTTEDLHRLLKASGCGPYEPVLLMGCKAGDGNDSIAARYAHDYGVPTVGASNYVWWGKDGFHGIYGYQSNFLTDLGYGKRT